MDETMESEVTTIEIDGVSTEIYAEEMGVSYEEDEADEDDTEAKPTGPVTIYRLIKREDAEAMGISLEEGSVSTPDENTTVITRQIIKLKKKLKSMLFSPTKEIQNGNSLSSFNKIIMLDDTKERSASKEFPCLLCQKVFRHPSHLKRHVNSHTADRTFNCDICNKNFLDISTLTRHKRTHSGERPYWCETCGKTFGTGGSLKRHFTIHNQEQRPYPCDVCPKRFPDRSSFYKHRLIHSGIKKYKCEACERAFVHLGDLNAHIKIHIALKPYRCPHCQREFAKNSNFARHLLIHQGDKELYKCHICEVRYNYQSSLTRHLLTHAAKKPGPSVKSKVKVLLMNDDASSPDGRNRITLRHIRSLVKEKKIVVEEEEGEEWWEGEAEGQEYEVIEVEEVFVGEGEDQEEAT